MLLHVWVLDGQVTTLSPRELSHSLLLGEVDVSFVVLDCLGLVEGLCESAGLGEWVWPGGCRHVEVLSFECLGVDGHWSLLGVVSLWDSLSQLIVSGLLGASVHASLDNQVLVT